MLTTTPDRTGLSGTLRVVLVLLGFSVLICYIDRGNLSIAAPMLKNELGISAAKLGMLLSAFFWTYACSFPVSGWIVDRVNVKWFLGGGFLLWSLATSAIGLVHAFAALFVLRMALGVAESVAYPSFSKIISLHFPEEHRGFANSVVAAGFALGPGCGLLLGGMLMARFGWRPFFVVLGLISLLWLIPWIRFMPSSAETHEETVSGRPSLPEFLRLRSAWGICIALFFSNFLNYFLLTWLPYYLLQERHFSMDKMAKIGGAAYLCAACFATIAGRVSDRWITAGGSPTQVRKTFVAGGVALAGTFLALCVINGPVFCVTMLVLGVSFMGVSASNIFAITQTLAGPQASGRWTGIQCFIGNLAGVAAPAITGVIVQRTGHFFWAFMMLGMAALTAACLWIFLVGRVEQVVWQKETKAMAVAA